MPYWQLQCTEQREALNKFKPFPDVTPRSLHCPWTSTRLSSFFKQPHMFSSPASRLCIKTGSALCKFVLFAFHPPPKGPPYSAKYFNFHPQTCPFLNAPLATRKRRGRRRKIPGADQSCLPNSFLGAGLMKGILAPSACEPACINHADIVSAHIICAN